jgi:hypothetical protein
MAASQPDFSTGQAVLDTVPQFSPVMFVAAVSTVTGRPACSEVSRHAAEDGSTDSTDGAPEPGRR